MTFHTPTPTDLSNIKSGRPHKKRGHCKQRPHSKCFHNGIILIVNCFKIVLKYTSICPYLQINGTKILYFTLFSIYLRRIFINKNHEKHIRTGPRLWQYRVGRYQRRRKQPCHYGIRLPHHTPVGRRCHPIYPRKKHYQECRPNGKPHPKEGIRPPPATSASTHTIPAHAGHDPR